jgi:putative cardiolipin synthase
MFQKKTPHKAGPTLGTDRLLALLLSAVIWLGGCATVDFDYPKTTSNAFEDTDDTHLGRLAVRRAAAHPGKSGFLLQPDGIDSMATRVFLAHRAERSIDAQYYLLTDDITGYLFLDALLAAADRGVRVRLLLDDIQTSGYDAGLAALDAHPNFEVRLFNPFARGVSRALNAIGDLSRINRRMHNKTFTVDNQFTIIGGRNIAAEYFAARRDTNFGDLDALAIGPVVQEVSRQFDRYWNDELALPVTALAGPVDDPEQALAVLRGRIAASHEKLMDSRYAEVLTRSVVDIIEVNDDDYTWAPYRLVYDAPEKAAGEKLDADDSILPPLRQAIDSAERELIVVSPYFVPSEKTIDGFSELVARGVKAVVITNSLASNDHAIVHSGYAPSRIPLLERGVDIYETRPDSEISGTDETGADRAVSRLHTKGFVVDRRLLFLGSFNWDPRSTFINTELGVIIYSPELAGAIGDIIDRNLRPDTYQVTLNDKGRLRWIGWENGEQVVYTKEPETGFWRRFSVNAMRVLPIRGQL